MLEAWPAGRRPPTIEHLTRMNDIGHAATFIHVGCSIVGARFARTSSMHRPSDNSVASAISAVKAFVFRESYGKNGIVAIERVSRTIL